jgi:CheY-like chemotaxis protein
VRSEAAGPESESPVDAIHPDRSSDASPSAYERELSTQMETGLGACGAAVANLAATRITPSVAELSDDDSRLDALMEQLGDLEPIPISGIRRSSETTPQRRRRWLIIDDSTDVRRSLALSLNGLGYEAIQARNGMEGLKEMQQSLFDGVFCDFAMPVMEGTECVSQFREWETVNRPWDRQLIIGISEHPHLNNKGQGLKAGMDMFYPKPITANTLVNIHAIQDVALRMVKLDDWHRKMLQANIGSGGSSASEGPQSTRLGGLSATLPPPFSGPAATMTLSPETLDRVTQPPTCLIAACVRMMQPDPFPNLLESKGWKVIIINNGVDCLKLLQVRNWDAVLVDDDLPQLAGVACITTFRHWEAMSRTTSIQKNVFLVCAGHAPSPLDGRAVNQPPNGFNGVLPRPVPLQDFEYLLISDFERGGSA